MDPVTISKAELARRLNVSAPRVGQYIASGMPVRDDGALDYEAVLQWLAMYKTSGRDRSKGPALAAGLLAEHRLKASAAHRSSEDAINVAGALLRDLGFIAARMAVAAGAPMKIAYALETMVPMEAAKSALELFPDPVNRELQATDWPWSEGYDCTADKAFWRKLAKVAGEPCDEAAWEAYHDALPWSRGA